MRGIDELSNAVKTMLKAYLHRQGYHVMRMSLEDARSMKVPYDVSVELPPGVDTDLSWQHPRLVELRRAYAALDLPITQHSQWGHERIANEFDLRRFRGHTPYVWQYRELPRTTRLKYFIFMSYVAGRDDAGLLARAAEDGAFGCWTYRYDGRPPVSRDVLDSVNEILFLDRNLGILGRDRLSVLDIGAGYGRMAHRVSELVPGLTDYCCVDAVPESTFLCEYYLRYRSCTDRARVVPLDRALHDLQPDHFDLAFNIHSFSECPLAAIEWWLQLLSQLRVPLLFLVPNEADRLLSLEVDGTRRDFAPAVAAAGFSCIRTEPVFEDPAVRELLGIDDRFFLFQRT